MQKRIAAAAATGSKLSPRGKPKWKTRIDAERALLLFVVEKTFPTQERKGDAILFMIRLKKAIVSWLPKSWRGIAQYHINPLILDGFGVFNGQCFRQLIFIDLNRTCHFEAIVETGTYVGCTTQFLARNANVPVHTVESNAKDFQVAKRHLKFYPSVHVVNANSVNFLSSLPLAQETRTFFYLDAHWEGYLPLAEEVEIVLSRFKNFVIMIDDFAVPGDEGYTYDDYGPGKRLSLRDFPFHEDPRLRVFSPSRHSSQESGARRGCIVLASPALAPALDSLDSLRDQNGSHGS